MKKISTMSFRLKDPGFCVVFLAFFAAKQKQRFFRVFRKPKIRKLHIFTFFMNFDIFSKFLVLTRVGTLNLNNTRSMVVLTRVGTLNLSNTSSRCARSLDVWPRVPAIYDVVAPDRVPEPLSAAGMSARCTSFQIHKSRNATLLRRVVC